MILGVPRGDVPRAVSAYRAHYSAGALLDVTVHDGVPGLLTGLCEDGATLAVATSKPEPFAVRMLEFTGLLPAFAGVHGATFDGTVRHKDQVVGLALAAHPEGRSPVLIGDRAHDVLGAAAHGLPCIGAGWGPAAGRAGGGRRRRGGRDPGRGPGPCGKWTDPPAVVAQDGRSRSKEFRSATPSPSSRCAARSSNFSRARPRGSRCRRGSTPSTGRSWTCWAGAIRRPRCAAIW